MASVPISPDDLGCEEQVFAPEKALKLFRSLRADSTVTVQLGSYLAEIHKSRHAATSKTTYCYSILDVSGEKIYQSGNGYISVCSVVEKAAQHLEMLWELRS